MVALVLAFWCRKKGFWRAAAYVLLLTLVLAGTLAMWRAIGGTTAYREFDRSQITMGRRDPAQDTPACAGPACAHIQLPRFPDKTALPCLVNAGWAWSRGLDHTEREAEIKRVDRTSPDAAESIRKEHVD
jgi:hypothetical protein